MQANGEPMVAPLEKLAYYLASSHPDYTITDVVRSHVKGYLCCLKPCPRAGQHWLCGNFEHYHTIQIMGIGYPKRDERGRFISVYRLWRELEGLLPDELPEDEWPEDDHV